MYLSALCNERNYLEGSKRRMGTNCSFVWNIDVINDTDFIDMSLTTPQVNAVYSIKTLF